MGPPNQATVKIQDSDEPTNIVAVANLNAPVGNDYHSPSNVLIVSLNFDTGLPKNFIQVRTNDSTANWTTISNMTGEINLACVRTTNGGWTVGDLYFNTGEGGQIGRVATPSSFNTNWTPLPDSQVQGLYFDQTGVFSNNLVAATADRGNVRLITSSGQSNMLATIGLPLESLLTLPNDTNKYCPWAGKILTGNEGDFHLFTKQNYSHGLSEPRRLTPKRRLHSFGWFRYAECVLA